MPKLLDQHKLMGRKPGRTTVDDAWVERMSQTIFAASPEQAAEAVAAALAEGILPDAVGEAISLAANRLVLRDPGRPKANPNRPSRWAAFTATRSASTPPTRPTPGATSPASATAQSRSPA